MRNTNGSIVSNSGSLYAVLPKKNRIDARQNLSTMSHVVPKWHAECERELP